MSTQNSSGSESSSDYPRISALWQREWEQERAKYINERRPFSIYGLCLCLLCAIGQTGVVIYGWLAEPESGRTEVIITSLFFAALTGLMLYFSYFFLRCIINPLRTFRKEPVNFATFNWMYRLDETTVYETALEIIWRAENLLCVTDDEFKAIMSMAYQSNPGGRHFQWRSSREKEIGIRSMHLAAALSASLPVQELTEHHADVMSSGGHFEPSTSAGFA